MSGLAYTAATRDLQTDVAFGRGADLHDDVGDDLKWVGGGHPREDQLPRGTTLDASLGKLNWEWRVGR